MQATDKTAPTLPPLSLVGIERGKGPQRAGCNSVSESDCDYRASIAIGIAATDDVTPSDSIGYRFSIVGGTPPQGLSLPTVPILQSIYAGQTGLGWDDGATDDQESFDFTLQVVAVDLAGNESAPQTLRIQHDPSTGCGVARVSSVPVRPATTFTLLAIAAVVRRTARRRPARRLTSL